MERRFYTVLSAGVYTACLMCCHTYGVPQCAAKVLKGRPELKQATTVPARNGGLSHRGSRTPQNKKSRDATLWRLYNYVGIENSLLTACELQIRKNGECLFISCSPELSAPTAQSRHHCSL